MKAEVLAPDRGNGRRDFHFTADVKRVHVYPNGFPEYCQNWLSIVEAEGGIIKVILHGKFVGDVQTVFQLSDDGSHTIPVITEQSNSKKPITEKP